MQAFTIVSSSCLLGLKWYITPCAPSLITVILHFSNFPSIGATSPAAAPFFMISSMLELYTDLFTLTNLNISLISGYSFFPLIVFSIIVLYDSKKSYSGNVILSFG